MSPTGHVPDFDPNQLQDPDEELLAAVAGEPTVSDLLKAIIDLLRDIRERQDEALLRGGGELPSPFLPTVPKKYPPGTSPWNPYSRYGIGGNTSGGNPNVSTGANNAT